MSVFILCMYFIVTPNRSVKLIPITISRSIVVPNSYWHSAWVRLISQSAAQFLIFYYNSYAFCNYVAFTITYMQAMQASLSINMYHGNSQAIILSMPMQQPGMMYPSGPGQPFPVSYPVYQLMQQQQPSISNNSPTSVNIGNSSGNGKGSQNIGNIVTRWDKEGNFFNVIFTILYNNIIIITRVKTAY